VFAFPVMNSVVCVWVEIKWSRFDLTYVRLQLVKVVVIVFDHKRWSADTYFVVHRYVA
jgi:hypothetical protein